MVRTSRLLLAVVAACASSLVWPAAARAQSKQSQVDLPRIEFAAGTQFKETLAMAESERKWSGPGFSFAVDGKVNDHLAATTEVDLQHETTVLAGGQVSTRFFYGSGRDPVPGRFFSRLLVGVSGIESSTKHPASQIAGGADLLLSRTRAIGLRCEVGYDFTAGAGVRHATGRAAIGLVFGPHVQQEGKSQKPR